MNASPSTTLQLLWKNVTDLIRNKLSNEAYERFFPQLQLLEDTGTHLHIGAEDEMCLAWVETCYTPMIQECASIALDASRQILFTLITHEGKKIESEPLSKLAAPISQTPKRKLAHKPKLDSNLNANFNFENFIVGPNSEFAHAAALAVAQTSTHLYNPLFLHGASGLGKTHLMQAIGNEIERSQPNCNVLYISCEQFANEYIDAIASKGKELSRFRNKYRKIDVLLLDDVQFFGGKKHTQDEFFHTFNTLFDGQKRIILSSDCPANEITKLEPRLVSRFESGLTVEVAHPGLETRIAILRKKRAQWKIDIPDDVISFLATNITKNVRRLEGALTRVATLASFSDRIPQVHEVEIQLRDLLREENSIKVSIDAIQRRVAEHYNIRLADMSSRRRPANIAHARQVAMFLARQLTNSSLQDIGDAFGGRDHGTVIHATKSIESKIALDTSLRDTVERMSSLLS